MKTKNCPYCNTSCKAPKFDTGVDVDSIAYGLCECARCGAVEIDFSDVEKDLSAQEVRTGWYEPKTNKTT